MSSSYEKNFVHIEIWISKSSKPLTIKLSCNTPVLTLSYMLLSLYNYPPNTEIILKNFKTEREELRLSDIEKIDTRFDNKFLISFVPVELQTEAFYQSLPNSNEQVISPKTIQECSGPLYNCLENISTYSSYAFKHELLYLAIRDIVNGNPTTFSRCLPSFLKSIDENSLFPINIVFGVFTEIFSRMFADKYECISITLEIRNAASPEISYTSSDVRNLSFFFADLIEADCPVILPIKMALKQFRPAPFVICFVIAITDELINRYDDPTAATLANKMFGCQWLYNAFTERSQIESFLNHKNYFDVFTCLVFRYYFYIYLKGWISEIDITATFLAYDPKLTWINKKASKSVFKAFFDCIFETIETDNIPCFVISEKQNESILNILKKAESVFKKCFSQFTCTQYQFLDLLIKVMNENNYEPKGLSFLLVNYFLKNKFLSEHALNQWLSTLKEKRINAEPLFIELNTFIISPIPKPYTYKNDTRMNFKKK